MWNMPLAVSTNSTYSGSLNMSSSAWCKHMRLTSDASTSVMNVYAWAQWHAPHMCVCLSTMACTTYVHMPELNGIHSMSTTERRAHQGCPWWPCVPETQWRSHQLLKYDAKIKNILHWVILHPECLYLTCIRWVPGVWKAFVFKLFKTHNFSSTLKHMVFKLVRPGRKAILTSHLDNIWVWNWRKNGYLVRMLENLFVHSIWDSCATDSLQAH